MLWMETYLFYCSVRLGVIFVAVVSFLHIFIPAVLLLTLGGDIVHPVVKLFENDDHFKKNWIIARIIVWMECDTPDFIISFNICTFIFGITCALAIYAAVKLKKWLLVPFIIFDLLGVVLFITCHIILMVVLKKILNLGTLNAFTLAGGFWILFLGYNWATSVALFQIINLINSERYKALYGDDPFQPRLLSLHDSKYDNRFAYGTIENVRVLVTPNSNDIDEQKQKQSIIAVLPMNTNDKQELSTSSPSLPLIINNNRRSRQSKWWQEEKAQKQQGQPLNYSLESQERSNNGFYYNDAVDYNYWQWTELVGAKNKQNALIAHNTRGWY